MQISQKDQRRKRNTSKRQIYLKKEEQGDINVEDGASWKVNKRESGIGGLSREWHTRNEKGERRDKVIEKHREHCKAHFSGQISSASHSDTWLYLFNFGRPFPFVMMPELTPLSDLCICEAHIIELSLSGSVCKCGLVCSSLMSSSYYQQVLLFFIPCTAIDCNTITWNAEVM